MILSCQEPGALRVQATINPDGEKAKMHPMKWQ